jgi:hypothetical protein
MSLTPLSGTPKDPLNLFGFLNQLSEPIDTFPAGSQGFQHTLQNIASVSGMMPSSQNGIFFRDQLNALNSQIHPSRVSIMAKDQQHTPPPSAFSIPSAAQKVSPLRIILPTSPSGPDIRWTFETVPLLYSGSHPSSSPFSPSDSPQDLSPQEVRKPSPLFLTASPSPVSFFEPSNPTTKKRRLDFDESIILPTSTPSASKRAFSLVDMDACTPEVSEKIQALKEVIEELSEIQEAWNSEDLSEFEVFIDLAKTFNQVRKKGHPLVKFLEKIPQAKEITNHSLAIYKAIKKQYIICTVKFMRTLTAEAKLLEKNKNIKSPAAIAEECDDILSDVNMLIEVRKILKNDTRIANIKKIIFQLQSEISSTSSSSSISSSSTHTSDNFLSKSLSSRDDEGGKEPHNREDLFTKSSMEIFEILEQAPTSSEPKSPTQKKQRVES